MVAVEHPGGAVVVVLIVCIPVAAVAPPTTGSAVSVSIESVFVCPLVLEHLMVTEHA